MSNNAVYTKQGVRNLDTKGWYKGQVEDSKETKEYAEPQSITDLIYTDTPELRQEILALWPAAELEGTWDEIHEGRLSVDLCARELDWLKWLIRSGWSNASLKFQMSLRSKDKFSIIEQAMDEECPGWRNKA